MDIKVSLNDSIETKEVLNVYNANGWSAAEKPELLMSALKNSNALVTARNCGRLVGIGNAISDGYLVVYYPHLIVHPDYQRNNIGRKMMLALQQKYSGFHQQMLTADNAAIKFYQSLGFMKAGNTESMWIYQGNEHK